ncbi:MAG: tRNA uridine-5-carboxymethylaminomethyl(34) synthesis GTPase MnmE [Ruminococcaceae bacterium]|nr:tRNA uridine-5-carboxymethylaminomethyl(34) synthesis GTPase MnmE [Oscillospiraceae bacterium]
MDIFSTVAAISTPYGTGGISIIRISGPDAVEIADKVFCAPSGKVLASCESHTIHYGYIKDSKGEKIDQVLVSLMKAPRTFTGEDTVEINCHGGIVVTNKVLAEVLKNGAVLADRGEFTKRAFLNGKIDLCEAESVIDIINSKTALQHQISVNNLGGALSEKINSLRHRLITLCANIQVLIDYPDEGLESISDEEFYEELKSIYEETDKLLSSSEKGKLIQSGIKTAIVGKPNVGKSSLMNLLSGEEKAIVTDIAGTTRDAIEEYINLSDVVLCLVDTAGIRETDDPIEKIGVTKSMDFIKDAMLIIFMADATSGIDDEDEKIMELCKGKKAIALINKTDSGSLIEKKDLENNFECVIEFSVKDSKGMQELESAIKNLFEMGEIDVNASSVITNSRHSDALFKAKEALRSAIDAIDAFIPIDTTFIDLETAASALGEIVGLTVSEEIVDRIFHTFCIGK